LIKLSTGFDLPYEILSSDEWVASVLIADKYVQNRVFLIGDACHLHPPFGGYGMNMGVGDAVDLGWKLAAYFHYNRVAFIVYGRNRYVDRDLKPITDYPVDWSPLLSEQKRRMMHFCLVPQPSLFFRRIAVTLCGALDSNIVDYELWMRWQKDLPFYFCDDYFSLSRIHDKAITANADRRLLRGICETVHQYYGAVPFSWAFKYAHTVLHGAAWARGESPPIGLKVRVLARWYWVELNLRWLPRLVRRTTQGLVVWVRQVCRIAS
jgi:hypothetical protein